MRRIKTLTSITVGAAAIAVYRLSLQLRPWGRTEGVSRRLMLKTTAVLGALAAAEWHLGGILARGPARGLIRLASCARLTPEQTEGPFYIAKEHLRRDIRAGRPGTPLKLKFTVIDTKTCKPLNNAAVDIWHCDGGGVYSGVQGNSANFLRGIQLTNSSGDCTFETIYPGWYSGRTVHIHVKVHTGGDTVNHVVHTGQLYFKDSLTAMVYKNQPYKSRASQRDTFNNTDSIYAKGGAQSMLAVKPDGKGGYVGSITLGVKK